MITRRSLLAFSPAAALTATMIRAVVSDPWSNEELLRPGDLAQALSASGQKAQVICVAFPVLYRQRHIAGAVYAGPGNKPEGLEVLRKAATKLSKDVEVVIYCGCCPMANCPNIRPSYQVLKELGFREIRVLEIPSNFLTDWTSKGYPVEPNKPV